LLAVCTAMLELLISDDIEGERAFDGAADR
jgi:hypothetical protein